MSMQRLIHCWNLAPTEREEDHRFTFGDFGVDSFMIIANGMMLIM